MVNEGMRNTVDSITEEGEAAGALHLREALCQHVRPVLDDGVRDVGHRLAVAARSWGEMSQILNLFSSTEFLKYLSYSGALGLDSIHLGVRRHV